MPFYDLPTTAEVGGLELPVRSDYRAALDLIQVMGDPELEDHERALLVMELFYDSWEEQVGFDDEGNPIMVEHGWWEIAEDDYQEAVNRAFWFVGGGKAPGKKKPKLMDWEQDFPLIAAPVNRVLGFEVRAVPYMHWWTFLAAYNEIGDCLFAQVVGIRKKKAKGKKLDKSDEAFYRENADIVNFKVRTSSEEEAVFDEWTRG